MVFTFVSLGVLGYLLFLAPGIWSERLEKEIYQDWNASLVGEANAIEQLLMAQPNLSAAFPSEAGEVRSVLQAHPTLMAVFRRGKKPRLWIRDGEGLVSPASPLGERFMRWARQAEASGVPKWFPPSELDPEADRMPSLVLVAPSWVFIKRWPIGSVEVERHLRLALGPNPRARVGIWRYNGPEQPPPASPAFEPPNLQTWPGSAMRIWNVSWISTDLGPSWEMVCQPWPHEGEAWIRHLRTQTRWAWVCAGAVALSLVYGLWLRRTFRRQEALTSDRLASLTHSLKTPLALHKLRCDTLRMGRLDPVQSAEELLRLGQEVNDLTRLIERALVSLQGELPQEGQAIIDAEWVRAMAEELRPAFEEAGRELVLELAPQEGRAHANSLRAALQTLLENAYYHGQGRVRLSTRKQGRRLVIGLSDQGPGLDAEALAALGKPFMRMRRAGQEGFQHEGQGLGLSLLFQMARQEGWGLQFESLPGQGLTVSLEIPG